MRILITGPECSGKSTLGKKLSEHLSIPWFPEYARTYLDQNGKEYQHDDILKIAKEHYELVNVFPLDQSMIYDTYLLNLKLWSEIKYGKAIPWIDEQLTQLEPFDYIFLMSPDLAWEQDGFRESERDIKMIFEKFQMSLDNLNWSYKIISGQKELRMQSVLAAIEN